MFIVSFSQSLVIHIDLRFYIQYSNKRLMITKIDITITGQYHILGNKLKPLSYSSDFYLSVWQSFITLSIYFGFLLFTPCNGTNNHSYLSNGCITYLSETVPSIIWFWFYNISLTIIIGDSLSMKKQLLQIKMLFHNY